MKLQDKGIRTDDTPNDAPNKSWRWAKNILIANGYKSITNELGFDKLYILLLHISVGFALLSP